VSLALHEFLYEGAPWTLSSDNMDLCSRALHEMDMPRSGEVLDALAALTDGPPLEAVSDPRLHIPFYMRDLLSDGTLDMGHQLFRVLLAWDNALVTILPLVARLVSPGAIDNPEIVAEIERSLRSQVGNRSSPALRMLSYLLRQWFAARGALARDWWHSAPLVTQHLLGIDPLQSPSRALARAELEVVDLSTDAKRWLPLLDRAEEPEGYEARLALRLARCKVAASTGTYESPDAQDRAFNQRLGEAFEFASQGVPPDLQEEARAVCDELLELLLARWDRVDSSIVKSIVPAYPSDHRVALVERYYMFPLRSSPPPVWQKVDEFLTVEVLSRVIPPSCFGDFFDLFVRPLSPSQRVSIYARTVSRHAESPEDFEGRPHDWLVALWEQGISREESLREALLGSATVPSELVLFALLFDGPPRVRLSAERTRAALSWLEGLVARRPEAAPRCEAYLISCLKTLLRQGGAVHTEVEMVMDRMPPGDLKNPKVVLPLLDPGHTTDRDLAQYVAARLLKFTTRGKIHKRCQEVLGESVTPERARQEVNG
jgi:hypothetical protein